MQKKNNHDQSLWKDTLELNFDNNSFNQKIFGFLQFEKFNNGAHESD